MALGGKGKVHGAEGAEGASAFADLHAVHIANCV
jgi:hypothetical protein